MKSCQWQFNKCGRTSGQVWLEYFHRRPQRGSMKPSARSPSCHYPSPSSLMTQSACTEPAWTTRTSSWGCWKVNQLYKITVVVKTHEQDRSVQGLWQDQSLKDNVSYLLVSLTRPYKEQRKFDVVSDTLVALQDPVTVCHLLPDSHSFFCCLHPSLSLTGCVGGQEGVRVVIQVPSILSRKISPHILSTTKHCRASIKSKKSQCCSFWCPNSCSTKEAAYPQQLD